MVLVAVVVGLPAFGQADDGAPPALERVSLRQAVERAMARNPGVAVAVAEVKRAAGLLQQVRASALPTLTGNLVYTRIDNNRAIGDQVLVAADQVQANLTLSVPLLAPPQWALWAEAADTQRVAALGVADVRRRIALATAHAYLAVLAQHRVVELNERARDTAQLHHEYSLKRLQGGVGSQLDEVRSAQEVATNQAQVEVAHANLRRAQGALAVLMGEPRPIDVAGEPELAEPPRVDADDAAEIARLPRARADLAALLAQRLANERQVKHMWTWYMPSLVGTFQPQFQEPATVYQPPLAWQAQLQLTVPLYDGGLRYGIRRERSARVDQARANLEGALTQARIDLGVGAEALQRAERARTQAKAAAEMARRTVAIAELSYRNGATSNLELIDAQRRAHDADTAAVMAEDEARQAKLDLLAAGGSFP